MHFKETLTSFDWILTGCILLLIALNLAMLFGTSTGDFTLSSRIARQLISLAIASVIFIVISYFPYHKLRRYAIPFYVIGIASLIIVSRLAPVIRGTTSRLSLIGLQIQPSEFTKVAIVIILAWLFAKYGLSRNTIILSAFLTSLAAVLIILEPDIGQAALLAALWLAFIVFLGTPWRYIVVLTLIGAIGFFGAWQWLFADYQKERILTFLNPSADPLGASYNITQSIVALGSGGLFGRGLGQGPQSQLNFLPEQHTDFILASIGEELGFVGISLVSILYLIMLWRIYRTATKTKDPFGQNIAVATFIILLISFFVSSGMNMGLLPVTGIPLPLVSYGGSSLVGTIILLALIQSVHAHSRWVRRPPSELAEFT